MINIKRIKNLRKGHPAPGPVLYWMSRDQRVGDNWALSYAVEMAENNNQPVMVAFCLVNDFLGATWRQYHFMLKGLTKVEAQLHALNIPFSLLMGEPVSTITNFIRLHKISHLVADFDPLRIKQEWQQQIAGQNEVNFDVVDAHNIVPCHIASGKEEFAAYTFRPKVTRLLPEFLDEYPPLIRQPGNHRLQRINWKAVSIGLKADHSVRPVEWLEPGEQGAMVMFGKFLETGLRYYTEKRNDPNEKCTSGLSPYLHFGHISAQRIALEIIKNFPRNENSDAFLEELIVRKELADNFCYHNRYYDSYKGFRPWALKTLEDHKGDKRDYTYIHAQFEDAKTHDPLWNAAQYQLVHTGTMHGYLRMYWAKKILEWSDSPEKAMKIAITLNDRYQLDGRDPNGYTGCAWSVGGVHDRSWGERNVFGKIRYMNRSGCERKFDVEKYIKRFSKRLDT